MWGSLESSQGSVPYTGPRFPLQLSRDVGFFSGPNFFRLLHWAVKQLLCLTTDVGALYGCDSCVYVCVPINKYVYI